MDTVTDSRLDMGGNNPPGKLELERAAALAAEVSAWSESRPEFVDSDEAATAQAFVEKLRGSKKELATAQKSELAPLDEAVAEVKTKYRSPVDAIEKALKSLLDKSGAWLKKEQARVAAEKAAKEAEARRQREEAERLAREAALAKYAASEEAETATRKAALAADEAKTAERVAAKAPEKAAIKSAPAVRAMTLRTYWRAEIADEAAALVSLADHPVVRKATLAAALSAANELARSSKSEDAAPAGFRFIKEERAS